MNRRRVIGRMIAMVLAAAALAACSRNDGRSLTPPRPDQTLSIATTTTTVAATVGPSVDGSGDDSIDSIDSSDDSDDGSDDGSQALTAALFAPWVAGDPIPDMYTCKGANQTPSLVWRGMQTGAVEQAIVMTDADANGFVQWLVVGIPPTLTNFDPSNIPDGAIVGQNSRGTSGYVGPCPANGRHSYFITLYSLRSPSGVTASTPPDEALVAINAAQMQSVSVNGTAGA
jgi:Raf kinase inhibitor-like YbhB/YbcL family protein